MMMWSKHSLVCILHIVLHENKNTHLHRNKIPGMLLFLFLFCFVCFFSFLLLFLFDFINLRSYLVKMKMPCCSDESEVIHHISSFILIFLMASVLMAIILWAKYSKCLPISERETCLAAFSRRGPSSLSCPLL